MKNSTILKIVLAIFVYSGIFGFLVPYLISEDSDVAALLGVFIAIAAVISPILFFNRSKKGE